MNEAATIDHIAPEVEVTTPIQHEVFPINPHEVVSSFLKIGKRATQGVFEGIFESASGLRDEYRYCALGAINKANGNDAESLSRFVGMGLSDEFLAGFMNGFDSGSIGAFDRTARHEQGFRNGAACLSAVKAAGLL